MDKEVIKFGDTEIEEYKPHQHEIPISINDIDTNKVVVSSELPFGKQDFNYFIGYKDAIKLHLYAYFIQKWVHIKEILTKRDFDKS